MSWAAKRQILYLLIVLLFIGAVSSYPIYIFFIKHTPTCFDNIMNQNEKGIDCGGVCIKACLDQVVPQPLVDWARIFPVSGSIYNLVAHIQNPNVTYIGTPTRYLFKVFDRQNILINAIENEISIPPAHTFAIFEQGVDADKRIPDHVTFEFTNNVNWLKYSGDQTELAVSDEVLSGASSTPRLDAVISNRTTNVYKNVEVIAILYDGTGNAVQSSRTFVPILGDHDSKNVTFTWPSGFGANITTVEIIPKVPFESPYETADFTE